MPAAEDGGHIIFTLFLPLARRIFSVEYSFSIVKHFKICYIKRYKKKREAKMKELLNKNEWNTAKILRVIFLMIADCASVCIATFLALFTRFEFDMKALAASGFMDAAAGYIVISAICTVAVFWLFKLYNSLWEFAGAEEFFRLVMASAASAGVQWLGLKLFNIVLPRSFHVLFFIFLAISVFCVRFSYRAARHIHRTVGASGRRTMIIGAGAAGFMTIRELNGSERSENKVVCVIDDDVQKHGKYIKDVKIVGGRDKIEEAAEKFRVEDIIFAIPSATNAQRKEIFDICSRTKCSLKTIPGLYQLTSGEVSVSQIRKIEI